MSLIGALYEEKDFFDFFGVDQGGYWKNNQHKQDLPLKVLASF